MGPSDKTRLWLSSSKFPDGILWLMPKPTPTVNPAKDKRLTIQRRLPESTKISAGIGNQATDYAAYKNVGLAAQQIFIVNNDTAQPDKLKEKVRL
jgi:hypothetical protein